MIRINDIAFDDYKVDSVELDTCILTMRVIFSKDDGRLNQNGTSNTRFI
jgi:hypothetical protein